MGWGGSYFLEDGTFGQKSVCLERGKGEGVSIQFFSLPYHEILGY